MGYLSSRFSIIFPSFGEKLEGRIAIKATEFLSDKNIVEISPANIVYAFNQYIGGAGRSTGNVISVVSSVGKGELPNKKIFLFLIDL